MFDHAALATTSPGPATGSAAMSPNVTQCHTSAAAAESAPALTGTELTERQLIAIECLIVGLSDAATARQLGMERRSIWRWRRFDDAFRTELARRRRELWTDAGDRLRGLLAPALDELDRQLHDRFDRTRYRAAATILRVANLRKDAPVPDPDAEPDDR